MSSQLLLRALRRPIVINSVTKIQSRLYRPTDRDPRVLDEYHSLSIFGKIKYVGVFVGLFVIIPAFAYYRINELEKIDPVDQLKMVKDCYTFEVKDSVIIIKKGKDQDEVNGKQSPES